VTQIIPVRFINAVQLAKDLAPLVPSSSTMTANEGGNALVITDTQTNIRRMAEIIKALDTTVSSLSSVRVFALRYADSKTVADMVKEVFASTDSGRSGSSSGRSQFRFGGFPGGGGGDAAAASTGRPGASKVVATADERSNSLVVSAPDDLMPTIEELVTSVDTNVEDVTEIRVFRLQHADPQETADLLASLFPDPTTTQTQGRSGYSGFFRGGPFGMGGDNSAGSNSERLKKQSKVTAVADNRTRSVVVTAARDTMTQISSMLEQLDSDPARKQKVFVFEVQNTDPTTVQQTLQDLFSGQSTTSSRNRTTTGQAGSQLNTRAQQQNQNAGTTRGTTTRTTSGNRTLGN
jgi:general secretion pathway protein D